MARIPKENTASTRNRKIAAITAMDITMTVETVVSFRVGQTTFASS